MLAAIWSQVDTLRPKQLEEKPAPTKDVCSECKGTKVFCDGLPVCQDCGLVEDGFVLDAPEWASGINDDGKVTDGSRCTKTANPELFSEQWGKSTVMQAKRFDAPGKKRLAKINFHMSMNHKDRSLWTAYRSIDESCSTLSDAVLTDAKTMYKRFNNLKKITRGKVRTGIKAQCVLYACRLNKTPRSVQEIADMFGITQREVTRTGDLFKQAVPENAPDNATAKPSDVMVRILNNFKDISREDRALCVRRATESEDIVELMSKTPHSIACGVLYITLKDKVTKQEVCARAGISIPTLNKIEGILAKELKN